MQLIHSVYFTLKDQSNAAVTALVASCRKYLTKQEGIVFFAAGGLAKELAREVNDRDWDVSLTLVFATPAHQDAYQTDTQHLQFIEENKSKWAKVRVFDSLVA